MNIAEKKSDTRPGTIQKFKDAKGRSYWRARITLCDGERRWLEPRFTSELLAREYAAEKSAEVIERKITLAEVLPGPSVAKARGGGGETCDEYFERLADARRSEGIVEVDAQRGTWQKWVSPTVGHIPVTTVTRDHIENVRDNLDVHVKKRLANGLSDGIDGKTARKIWSIVRTTFQEAICARNRNLRVRTDDPSAGHKPPLETPSRLKTFIYPVELTQLLGCPYIPPEWLHAYAIGAYSYLRPEELQGITWSDVDLTAGTISVSKAMDGRTGKFKPMPKTAAAVREVPIEKNLLPLLHALRARRESDAAPVVPILRKVTNSYHALFIRKHLRAARVSRPRLYANTLTLCPVNFRTLRDTGITWLALTHLSLHAIQRRCGHVSVNTTNGYVKMAEDIADTVGQPFPPIPSSLLTV